MRYVDDLRSGRWIPDPGDRVAVVPEHRSGCRATNGHRCTCRPRLVLRMAGPPPRRVLEVVDEELSAAG